MNTFVVDPHWGWWIIFYFFLGGIAAGAYFVATLAELCGDPQHRRLGRAGYYLAAPLVALCGILLILDLNQPARFWHMLFDHDTWLPHIKYWSPMSVGAWALLLFGVISTLSFFAALAEDRRLGLGRWSALASRLHRGPVGRVFDLLGTLFGFFIASYTGALLTATNQPVWSDSLWIGALFLASSATTGIAAIELASSWNHRDATPSYRSLDSLERWALALELGMLILFLTSLGPAVSVLFRLAVAIPFWAGAVGLGVIVPLVLRCSPAFQGRPMASVTALFILAGGFFLRYAVLAAAPVVLDRVGNALLVRGLGFL